jgi:hypothetical protein
MHEQLKLAKLLTMKAYFTIVDYPLKLHKPQNQIKNEKVNLMKSYMHTYIRICMNCLTFQNKIYFNN